MSSYGPVDKLEEHLQPDWWKKIFNAMYLKTDGDVVQDEAVTKNEVTHFIERLGMQKSDVILDLACGQGRHILELARRGFTNVYGLDQSAYLIKHGRKTARKEKLNIHFRAGDVRQLPYDVGFFDCVTILGNSFGYFNEKYQDEQILKEVLRILKPGGKILMDIADGSYLKDNFAQRSWEWIDQTLFVCRERSLADDGERLISREVITDTDKGVIIDQFYAERLYSRKELTDLLKKTGFDDVSDNSSIQTLSQRNQDLGMMEKRFVISGVTKNGGVKKRRKKIIKNIAVIMGDPSQKDIIKPDAVFDADDMETINKLETALGRLKGYDFQFMKNHATLLYDLKNAKQDIDLVFNLCDEGFNNDPRKELHVPALLEMLDIPYTGSRPQNLAICYDKLLVRGVAAQLDIPTAKASVIQPGQNQYELGIPFPVIVKPNYGDSSFGITRHSVIHSPKELVECIRKIRQQFGHRKPILVEELLTGADLTIGIIGNPPDKYTVFPIIEEDYSALPDNLPKICGYEAKWLPASPYFNNLKSIPADLPPQTRQAIIDDSLTLFERLECRDYARFDWRLHADGSPKLLEVNPNPGWCWDGHLAKMAALVDVNYSAMLGKIFRATERRISKKINQ